MRYPEYLRTTSPEERIFNYQWSLIHGLKEAYWQTPEDERADFLREPEEIKKFQASLDEMIEQSLQLQREENERRAAEEAEQAALGGQSKRRKVGQRGHLTAVPNR